MRLVASLQRDFDYPKHGMEVIFTQNQENKAISLFFFAFARKGHGGQPGGRQAAVGVQSGSHPSESRRAVAFRLNSMP